MHLSYKTSRRVVTLPKISRGAGAGGGVSECPPQPEPRLILSPRQGGFSPRWGLAYAGWQPDRQTALPEGCWLPTVATSVILAGECRQRQPRQRVKQDGKAMDGRWLVATGRGVPAPPAPCEFHRPFSSCCSRSCFGKGLG